MSKKKKPNPLAIDHNKIMCDYRDELNIQCPFTIHIQTVAPEKMRAILDVQGWWMSDSGQVMVDRVSGEAYIGFPTYCAMHRNLKEAK